MLLKIDPVIEPSVCEMEISLGSFANNLQVAKETYSKVVIVTDENIDKLFLQEVDCQKIVLPAGEEVKSFEELENLVARFSDEGLMRNSLVIACGGGVIGDLAGFAASIYLRGIDYWQVPTSLLAMVDSSMGGKTGINTKAGKNLIGNFRHPEKIVCDLAFLKKLPEKEVKNGLAEMVKQAFIADLALIEELMKNPLSEESIGRAAKVKVDIVNKDPFEKKERKYLNVGHTFAHAIEKDSELEIAHGVAVAIGMAWESKLAYKLGILSADDLNLILDTLNRLGLKTDYKIKDLVRFQEFLKTDKKNISSKISFAFIKVPGSQIQVAEVDLNLISDFLQNEIS